MKKRTREYVLLVITAIAGVSYGWLTREWSLVPLLGGMAGILVVIAFVGMPWAESAPDGAFRRRQQP
jgi:CHASE2 domain-containing sensor protein